MNKTLKNLSTLRKIIPSEGKSRKIHTLLIENFSFFYDYFFYFFIFSFFSKEKKNFEFKKN